MKKLLCVLMCVCVVSLAQAIVVENSSFELPGAGKIKGWDQADGAYYTADGAPAEVPGWQSIGTVVDSGVEAANVSDGTYAAFLMTSDPAVYQVTNQVISLGATYTLTASLKEIWNALDIEMAFYYTNDGGATLNALYTQNVAVNQDYAHHDTSIMYTVTNAAAVGSNLVILFDDTTIGAYNMDGWAAIDNVRLVPEPATMLMLGLGGVLLRRKK